VGCKDRHTERDYCVVGLLLTCRSLLRSVAVIKQQVAATAQKYGKNCKVSSQVVSPLLFRSYPLQQLCAVSIIPLPFPFTVAVAVALARRRRRLAGQQRNGTTENRACSYLNGRTVTVAFCHLWLWWNGIFLRKFYRTTQFYNDRTATRQRKNGNGMVETAGLVPNSSIRTPATDMLYNTTNGRAHNNSTACCTTNLPHRNARA